MFCKLNSCLSNQITWLLIWCSEGLFHFLANLYPHFKHCSDDNWNFKNSMPSSLKYTYKICSCIKSKWFYHFHKKHDRSNSNGPNTNPSKSINNLNFNVKYFQVINWNCFFSKKNEMNLNSPITTSRNAWLILGSIDTWHSYVPESRGCGELIFNVHSSEPSWCIAWKRWSFV